MGNRGTLMWISRLYTSPDEGRDCLEIADPAVQQQIVVAGPRDQHQPFICGTTPAVQRFSLRGRDEDIVLAVDNQSRPRHLRHLGRIAKPGLAFVPS